MHVMLIYSDSYFKSSFSPLQSKQTIKSLEIPHVILKNFSDEFFMTLNFIFTHLHLRAAVMGMVVSITPF